MSRVPDPAPSTRRAPRSLFVHAAVDIAVCFLAIAVVGLILGLALPQLIAVSLAAGMVAAPLTRRAEIRALSSESPAPEARD